jgi:hypothetical protein
MNNRAHKKEKAKKRSKEYFVNKACQDAHCAVTVIHSEASNTPKLCSMM